MALLRRYLRIWAAAWLILQGVAVSAFAPADCCARRRDAALRQDAATVAGETHCPMRGADGSVCPMHRDGPAATGRSPEKNECAMRGTCNAPVDALATLLLNYGIPTAVVGTSIDRSIAEIPAAIRQHAEVLVGPPDAPPPRPR